MIEILLGMTAAAGLAVAVGWTPWRTIAPGWVHELHLCGFAVVVGLVLAGVQVLAVALIVGVVIMAMALSAQARRLVARNATTRARQIRERERADS